MKKYNIPLVYPTELRPTVQARFADGRVLEGLRGTPLEAFILAANQGSRLSANAAAEGHIVASLMNGRLRELCFPLTEDADLAPVTMATNDGSRIYRRSLSFLMIAAAAEVLPGQVITIHHSMPFGGYYCERNDGRRLTDAELAALRQRMRELVEADLPIVNVRVRLDEALAFFREQGDLEKVDLFARRRKDYLTLYELNGVRDYFHGFMVPRTGYLDLFDLCHYNEGFILQFPRRSWPNVLQPFEDEPRLAQIFQTYKDWLTIVGVGNVTSLNDAIASGRAREVVLVAEALHQRQLASIARAIANRQPAVRLVAVSGPTSAGKTTFAKRLALHVMSQGIYPVIISLDDYFLNREDTPRDLSGNYDFEALEAVDLELFQKDMRRLMAGEEVLLPRFNFKTGRREEGAPLRIGKDHVVLVEGIHGLNPRLTASLPESATFRIFISAFTQLNLDKHNRVPTTDTRLLRRIVRDAAHRGYSAQATIGRWSSVRRGEKTHIFPYQNSADVFFNSALVYELSALKPMAEPLLLQVEAGTPERLEANRLLAFLQWFAPLMPEDLVFIAHDSILREFIGGSLLETFHPSYSYRPG
ncbi:nucleoside kinase [Promineifilum sp.]|uniref:nucleoside kinase n=1 Tax=Promineifilum sp. TaxID=2664178 RepID=UPI0035B4BDBE